MSLASQVSLLATRTGQEVKAVRSEIGFKYAQEATPTATRVGQTWFNTATGKSYVWYDSFWVQIP